MEAGLASKHPDIKSYRVAASTTGVHDPADLTPLGFHASVRSPKGAWYINPTTTSTQSLCHVLRRGT